MESDNTNEKTCMVHALSNEIEAVAIQALLEGDDIPFFVKPFYDSAYDGLFKGQKGYGEVFVFEHDEARSKSLIEEFLEKIKKEEEPNEC